MAHCNYCKSIIFIGGKKQGDLRFCGNNCFLKGQYLLYTEKLPSKTINDLINTTHQGACPKCHKKNGPVDIHTSYKIWSFILVSYWQAEPEVSCRTCGVKAQLSGTVSSLLLGWWGLPWGIIMTPIQATRNVLALVVSPNPFRPSKKLQDRIKFNLGQQLYYADQEKSGDSE